MSRLTAIDPVETTGKTKELFNAIKGKMGMVPNMMRTMGNSPAVLNAYLSFNEGLSHSLIGGKLRELIALTVAYENGCNYCNSAHSYFAAKIGLAADAIEDARHGVSTDAKIDAALNFAKEVLHSRGAVSNADISNVKQAGYSEGEIMEIIAQAALSIFTNYVNIVASTDIDFPELAPINK